MWKVCIDVCEHLSMNESIECERMCTNFSMCNERV